MARAAQELRGGRTPTAGGHQWAGSSPAAALRGHSAWWGPGPAEMVGSWGCGNWLMREEILSELSLWGGCFRRQNSLREALAWHSSGMHRDAVELDCILTRGWSPALVTVQSGSGEK